MADAKQQAASFKEGGKKGVDLQGVSAMGGVCFFNLAVDTPNGDMALLEKVMEGANVEVDEAAEERKGGAGDLGKCFLSAGDKQLAVYFHLPKALSEAKGISLKEWSAAVLGPVEGHQIIEESEEFLKAVSPQDQEKGYFPLKQRDDAINAGFAWFREKGLIPAADDSSSDDVNYAEAAGVEW
ncbi:expressed protein [Chlorella variabilis]|uniref:Expressed protein n=1 Tax=Chlorella variabilis TaxID=554065 RepID=E1Z4X1_CHLVA|nr:expressed protein [Chlorella variabilis]EFN59421.1 expressed protein [Chlorella variabilis]|eukprot:XP_005851523.1 expressed protein [Chlorella variabilis]